MEIIKRTKPQEKVSGTSLTRKIFQTICKLFQSIGKKKEKPSKLFFLSSPKDMLIDFREKRREGERDRERNISVREKCRLVASYSAPMDQTRHQGTCPDWELNLQPLSVRDNAPTTWATLARAQTILLCEHNQDNKTWQREKSHQPYFSLLN